MFFLVYRLRLRLHQPSCTAVLVSLFLLTRVTVSCAQALTFDDALSTAIREAPVLRANTALIEAAQYATVPAGELPDPKLILGMDNLPIEGEDRFSTGSDFMTMQRIGLMQEFTNTAKRRARTEQANAQVDVMRADERVQRQTVLRETALAWIERYTWEQQLALVAEMQHENRLLDDTVRIQLATTQGTALEALLPRQEAADIAALQDEITAGREQSIAQLRRWIGAAADLPLGGASPTWPIDHVELRDQLHQHPELLSFDSKERAANATIAESRAAQQPDWDVTLAYLERGSGYSDMAMLEVRVDLPVFTHSRQTPVIASKQALRTALAAEREASERKHAAMLELEVSEYHRLQQADRRFNDVLLPLADEKVALALASWRSGTGTLPGVIGARRERIATRLKAIANRGALQQKAAQLYYSYGNFSDDGADDFTGVRP